MSSLLARLGHRQVKQTAYSLRSPSRKRIKIEQQFVECRANVHPALSQTRSYGDVFRSPVSEVTRREEDTESSSPGQDSPQQTQQTRKQATQSYAPIYSESATSIPSTEYAEPVSPLYPAQDARPSARAKRATREPEDNNSRTEEQQFELWEQFERLNEADNASVDGEIDQGPSLEKAGTIDYKVELPLALLNGQADLVTRCLFAAVHDNDHEFLRDIPATTFSEIVRVLEPRRFMSSLASAHLELSAAMTRHFGIAPMREVAYQYASVLKEVFRIRHGIRKTLSDFKTLLRSYRDLGHQHSAIALWKVLLAEGHTPDTKCYNLYMASAVWKDLHSAPGRRKTRVIDFNMKARQKKRLTPNFRQYRVGADGVRDAAMTIFNEMLANGAIADEESFRILMTAASREGDMATVKSILNKVWSIDVDALLAAEDESSIAPKSLPINSALHPTPQLLFVIAQAFGSNNDIPTALRVVDFVARHYHLPITRAVWSQLFEWTFVLALDRHGTDIATGSTVGQLPPDSLLKLWDTMTSAPYHVQPTMGMYNHLIKNLFQRSWTPKIAEKMQEGRKLYTRSRNRAINRRKRLQAKLENEHSSKDSVEKLRHDFEAAELIRRRDLFWVKRWLRLLLGTFQDWSRLVDKEKPFATELPLMLWNWRNYAPTVIWYETPTGYVEFKIRNEEEMERFAWDQFDHKRRVKESLKGSERFVGERWLGGEVTMAKRLLAKD